jgi:hypothetical protein
MGKTLMENSQTVNFSNELVATQMLAPDLAGDYIWKSLYSHSYTIIFNCEKCNYQFDIDGWFYQFETIQCPHCNTIFSGYFGKVLPSSKNDGGGPQKNVLKLESFDDQEFEIQLSSNANVFSGRQNHIVLVVFSKPKDRNSKPWCWFDWSTKNSKPQYFQPQIPTVQPHQEPASIKKPKSMVPFILLMLLSFFGIIGLFLLLTQVI